MSKILVTNTLYLKQ